MSENAGLSGLRSHRPSDEGADIPPPARKWLTRWALPVTILVVALVLLAYAARDSLRPAITVRTVQVVSKTLGAQNPGTVTVQAPGWVEADPFPIYVPALTAGVVEEMLVLEGEPVKAGQVVARMIDDDAMLALSMTQAELKDRQAQYVATQATLTAAQTDWDNPIELDRAVAVAAATVEQIRAERVQLDSEIAQHHAMHEELEDKHRRLAALLPDSASEQQVVQARSQRDAHQGLVEVIHKKVAIIETRLVAAEANLTAAREHRRLRIKERQALDRAQAEVARLQAHIEEAEVAVAEAQLRLDRMAIRSPVAGIVMTRLAVPGSKLMLDMDAKLSANAVHLYDPNKLQVRVDVPLADAAQVGIDQAAEITVDVLPDVHFAGKVTRVVHEADIQKNTLQVKVAIHDPTPQLKPEMLARVKFLGRVVDHDGDTTTSRVFVPQRLLENRSGDQATVWLVDAKGKAVQRTITLGRQVQEGWIETVAGLNPGDRLIADASGELKEGKRVNITGGAQP